MVAPVESDRSGALTLHLESEDGSADGPAP